MFLLLLLFLLLFSLVFVVMFISNHGFVLTIQKLGGAADLAEGC